MAGPLGLRLSTHSHPRAVGPGWVNAWPIGPEIRGANLILDARFIVVDRCRTKSSGSLRFSSQAAPDTVLPENRVACPTKRVGAA